MKLEKQILTGTGIDKTGDHISAKELVSLYHQIPIPLFMMGEHDTISAPAARLFSKSLAIGIRGDAVSGGVLVEGEGNSPFAVVAYSGDDSNGGEFTEDEILNLYERLCLPSLPNVATASDIHPWAMSKVLVIVGSVEVLDAEKMKGTGGFSIGFSRSVTTPHAAKPHVKIAANPELFDVADLEGVFKFSRQDFRIGVSPFHQKAMNKFPWIIGIAFVASSYFSSFLGELGRGHAESVGNWLSQLLAKYEPKADGEIKCQFSMPLEIGNPPLRLKIAVGAENVFQFPYDERKVIGEIERQSARKIADIQEVSVSYLGKDVYRLEYAITRSGELIKPPTAKTSGKQGDGQ